jgi:hypothetical protein
MRFRVVFLVALAAGQGWAQTAADREWLASPPAVEFRERVIQLALIHGDSNGIDLRDYMIRTRLLGEMKDGCGEVEVVTLKGNVEVRRETVRACRAH